MLHRIAKLADGMEKDRGVLHSIASVLGERIDVRRRDTDFLEQGGQLRAELSQEIFSPCCRLLELDQRRHQIRNQDREGQGCNKGGYLNHHD